MPAEDGRRRVNRTVGHQTHLISSRQARRESRESRESSILVASLQVVAGCCIGRLVIATGHDSTGRLPHQDGEEQDQCKNRTRRPQMYRGFGAYFLY